MLKRAFFKLLVSLSIVVVLLIVYNNSSLHPSSLKTIALESYEVALHSTEGNWWNEKTLHSTENELGDRHNEETMHDASETELGNWQNANDREPDISIPSVLEEFLQLNRNDVLSKTTEVVPDYCAGLLQNDKYYKHQVDSFLAAWHKFVPPQSEMDSSNCWYAKNVDLQTAFMARKQRMSRRFYESYKQGSNNMTDKILDNIFSSGNKVEISARPTRYHFCIPEVDLIGFRKTGSDSIFGNLASHPHLARPITKESQFWGQFSAENDQKYRELAVLAYIFHFYDPSHAIARSISKKYTIDASISTLLAMPHPARELEKDACVVPLVLSQAVPKMKLLVSTRDPTERLWSDFLFFCKPERWKEYVGSNRSAWAVASAFHNHAIAAIEEFRTCTQNGHSQLYCVLVELEKMTYDLFCHKLRLGASMYYVALVRWFQILPQEQLLVLRLEDLSSDSIRTMGKVWDFLDLPSFSSKFTSKVRNQSPWSGKKDDDKIEMFPETRRLLDEFFHPYNVKFAELLGDDRFLWNKAS